MGPAAAAAEDEGPIAVLLIVRQVLGGHVQVAAVGGQLLGHHVHQGGGLELRRIGGGQEGVQKEGRMAGKPGAELLPALAEVAELPGQDPALEQGVQLEAQVLLPTGRCPAQVA